MSSNRPHRVVLLLSTLSLLSACAFGDSKPTPVPTVSTPASAPIDLQKFMGTWYVIGRVPNPVERGHVASVNQYTLRGDQKVAITYRFRDGFSQPQQELTVRASVDEESGNHNWRTWFYKVVPTHTRVLEVAPDYSWAMLGYPGREMAWIFARKPDMDKDLYKELATRLRDQYGVNTDKLKRVPQHPEQVDRLGYEVPNVR
ncbi:lipocalin family protein [Stenotrophomonas sp. SORGH_AS_0282]|jgi:apolipoprotein D and lipocalin family protein|uniref:lipocalin family protein n=1 Tax=Stenotrophomonas sp. SORGH_AS_0282 TaxID=3041763 RepID=UPI0027805CE7|nr:lipocalin family protein [Stenotrophomonas sp. SORGH_AS_0282]MDQ1061396.1 apolipoprotein D and lipocalin family protein [Stenotrophomonas sp. SORGH_AS_0282]MDQ1190254.1 apolipoprotein D and lipocalin family protein [Stenotrophomonas sp. SORGH_AS_0282]